MLLAASASDRLRGLVVSAPYTRDVVARYVAGDDASAAVAATQRLQAEGLQVSLDYLGEDTTSQDQAGAVAGEYAALLDRLAAGGLTPGGAAGGPGQPPPGGLPLPPHGGEAPARRSG